MFRLPDALKDYAGFSRPARLMLLGHFTLGIAGAVCWLVLNFYLKSLGYEDAFIGFFNGLSAALTVMLALPLGSISGRLGRSRALVLGAVGSAGAIFAYACSARSELLVAAACVSAVAGLLIGANTPPFLAEHSTPEQRTHLFSAQAAISTGTGLIGSMIGGVLPSFFAHWFRVPVADVLALRGTLYAAAAMALAGALPFLLLPHEPPIEEPRASERSGSPPAERPPAGLFARLLLPHALVGLGAGCTMPFMNLYIEGKFGVKLDTLGMIFGWSSLVTAASMLVQPWMAARHGKVRAVLYTQAASIPFLLTLGFVPWFPAAAVALFVRGALMNMAVPVYNAFAMERIATRHRALFVSLEMMIWSGGWALGSNLSGLVRSKIPDFVGGFHLMFAAMAILYVSSIGCFAFWFGRESAPAPLPDPVATGVGAIPSASAESGSSLQ